MGCDIHYVIERKHDNTWVGVYSTDFTNVPVGNLRGNKNETEIKSPAYVYPDLKGRNYEFFEALCGVRSSNPNDFPSPEGIPDDSSSLTDMCLVRWNGDAHSESFDSLKDFVRKRLITDQTNNNEKARKVFIDRIEHGTYLREQIVMLSGIDINDDENLDDYRVIYWFDN